MPHIDNCMPADWREIKEKTFYDLFFHEPLAKGIFRQVYLKPGVRGHKAIEPQSRVTMMTPGVIFRNTMVYELEINSDMGLTFTQNKDGVIYGKFGKDEMWQDLNARRVAMFARDNS